MTPLHYFDNTPNNFKQIYCSFLLFTDRFVMTTSTSLSSGAESILTSPSDVLTAVY